MSNQEPQKYETHISEVRSFRTCRRQWGWSSRFGRNLEPNVPYPPFYTGRIIHSCLEHYYRSGTPLVDTFQQELLTEKTDLWPQEEATFAEQEALMYNILQHYQMWVSVDHKAYSDENLEFISLEKEFRIPLPTPHFRASRILTLGGRFDGVVRHKPTGQYWIWENKTCRSIKELVNSLANDEQCGVYMYAASKMLRVPIVGVLYNMIRKKAPTRPDILQNGALSKAKSIDCTPFFYYNCVRETYPDWSNDTIQGYFGSFIATLEAEEKEQQFFLRYPVRRSQYEINMLMNNIYWTAREMQNPHTHLYPSPSRMNCQFCMFKTPCLTMNAGGDYETILQELFQQRPPYEAVDDDTEEIGNGKEVGR